MTLNQFKEFIETFGSNPARWPEDRKMAANAFIKDNGAAAQSLLDAEAAFDQLLETARVSPGTDILKARILNKVDAPKIESQQPANRPSFGYKAIAALMTLSFTVGFAGASYFNGSATESVEDQDYFVSAEWSDLAEDYDTGLSSKTPDNYL